jgi:hypothetical protein
VILWHRVKCCCQGYRGQRRLPVTIAVRSKVIIKTGAVGIITAIKKSNGCDVSSHTMPGQNSRSIRVGPMPKLNSTSTGPTNSAIWEALQRDTHARVKLLHVRNSTLPLSRSYRAANILTFFT